MYMTKAKNYDIMTRINMFINLFELNMKNKIATTYGMKYIFADFIVGSSNSTN